MDRDLIIGLSLIFILVVIQVILIIYNRHIVEEIHNKKLHNIREIKKTFFHKNK